MRRARGFTLIEVVMAVGLLVALCAGAAMVMMLTLNTIDRSRHRALALILARAKLEQVLSLEGTQPSDQVDYLDAQAQPVASSAARYERRCTITRTGTGPAELLIVQVRVVPLPARDDRDAVWIAGGRLRRSQ